MLRGQAYTHFFLTGQKTFDETKRTSPILFKPGQYVTRFDFLAGEGQNPASLPARPLLASEFQSQKKQIRENFYSHNAFSTNYFIAAEKKEPGHYPLPDIGGAILNRFFYQLLGLSGEIESFQIFYLLISALGIYIVFNFTFDLVNQMANKKSAYFSASTTAICLALFPIFFAESHFNPKDPLQATFYAGSLWSLWNYVVKDKLKYFILFTIFVALALAVKWNIVFLPFIVFPWLFLIRKTPEFKKWFKTKKLWLIPPFLVFNFAFLTLISPFAWQNPIDSFATVISFYGGLGLSSNNIQPDGFILPLGFNLYPPALLFAQTPTIILLLLLLAVISLIRNRGNDRLKGTALILIWLLVPLSRSFMPGVKSYSGIRQIMEVFPAIAILAGLGANYLMANRWKIKNVKWQILVATLILSLITFNLSLITITLHPNENVYFNAFVGSLRGAQRLNLIDQMITYGNVYKQATSWLNQNAEPNANLAILDGYMFAASPLWLRPDISLSPYHFSGFEQKGEYIFALYRPNEQAVFAQLYPLRFLKPVHTISVQGVPLLFIYKNDKQFLLSDHKNEWTQNNPITKQVNFGQSQMIGIDLGREVKVTRIILKSVPKNCQLQNYSPFIDEFITFTPQNPNLKATTYGINEKENLPQGQLEISFPAQTARKITISIQSNFSCFLGSKISEIRYVQ